MVKLTGVDITFASDFRRRSRCWRKSWLRHALNNRKSKMSVDIQLLASKISYLKIVRIGVDSTSKVAQIR